MRPQLRLSLTITRSAYVFFSASAALKVSQAGVSQAVLELGGNDWLGVFVPVNFADAPAWYGYFGRGAELAVDLDGGLEH